MPLSSVTTSHVTNASGTIAIASTSTSMGVATVVNDIPIDAYQVLNTAHQVISTADLIGICSATVMTLSFIYHVYSTRKARKADVIKQEMDEKFYALRVAELELERAKFLGDNE